MKLYLYCTETRNPVLEIDNVVSYTADEIRTEDGTVFSPLADTVELSSLPDCSEALCADWRDRHPSAELRLEELEMLVAGLLFGGEDE